MRLFGFHLRRFREWKDVLQEESRESSFADLLALLWKMAGTAFRGLFNSDRRWHHKIRACYRCPLFDRQMKRCRPYTGSALGCGCWTPALALFSDDCWGDEHLPGKVGWNRNSRISYTT